MSTHDLVMAAAGGAAGSNDLVFTVTMPAATQFGMITSGINGTVSWGDGTANSVINGASLSPVTTQIATVHTYSASGTYTIRLNGAKLTSFTYWLPATGSASRVVGVNSFGNFFSRLQFIDCTNLATLPSELPSTITSTNSMFYGCFSFNLATVSGWDTSNITDMGAMFWGCQTFNRSLNSWNTSNVTNMADMFNTCYAFNQPLGAWDVADVTTFASMFYNCSVFNQDLSSWDTGSATNMSSMFYNCLVFNQPLNSWDVSSVTNMSGMLGGSTSYNYPLSSWDVSNVTTFASFISSPTFNQSLNSWDVSSATNMSSMFNGCSAYNQSMSSWDTSSVTSMNGMFLGAGAFNQLLTNFDTSNVTDMGTMFLGATSFNQPLNHFDTSNVVDMELMFNGATSFNQPLNNWDTVNVTDMQQMFYGATAFAQNLSGWCVGNIPTGPFGFSSGAGALTPPVWGTCPAYSPASSITLVGSATGTNSSTLPTHQAGDLILAFVFRKNSTSLATQPSGWTTIASRASSSVLGSGSGSIRLSYKIAQSSSEATGTWTNGTAAIFVVYRGADTANLVNYVTTNAGSFVNPEIVYPDGLYWSSLAWTVAFVASNATTLAIETPPTGASTLVANFLDANNESASFDSNGPTTAFTGPVVSVGGNSLFLTAVLRLRVPITL